MIPDIGFEACVLRAALLVGRVHEREVIGWAEALLAGVTEPASFLADVASARPELTALREALRPLAAPVEPGALSEALLLYLATDPVAAVTSTPDRVRVLGQLRREGVFPVVVASAIKSFEDRWMLAGAGVTADPSLDSEFDRWLRHARGTAYYRLTPGHPDELAALFGALSRKVVRDRRAQLAPGSGCRAWLVGSRSETGRALMLNEPLWRVAVAEFSPLPLGSRIPYARIPGKAVLVLDEATAEPMGLEAAGRLLAAV